MGANQVFLIVFAISFLGTLVLVPTTLKWGLKWAGITNISLVRAFGLYLLILLAMCLVLAAAGIVFYLAGLKISTPRLNIIAYMAQFMVPCFVIAAMYKTRLGAAAKATIPFFLLGVALELFANGVKTYGYEGFVIPAESMAPTLLGEHWEAPCPRCGQPAYGSPENARRGFPMEGVPMICSKELRTVYVKTQPTKRGGGGRFLACKFLKPRRWDLVVFGLPADPKVKYVKRLVGLPGEKLAIRDGAVWINGERVEPPAAIHGIHYSPTIELGGNTMSGPGSVPVELRSDEYYVLGDFVDVSSDSRFWQEGAPGHPPYAVPASHMVGVVIDIYWPPSRWTSFR